MKYISIDIETTGLNPLENDILEIGAYIEDTLQPLPREEMPFFHAYVWKDSYRGNPEAFAMNKDIIDTIVRLKKEKNTKLLLTPADVAIYFRAFLFSNKGHWNYQSFNAGAGPFTLAGKNLAGFDLPFLNQLEGWAQFKFYRRIIDPAILYFDSRVDEVLPDMSTCKARAGLSEHVSHHALDDAWDVISLVRYKYPTVP